MHLDAEDIGVLEAVFPGLVRQQRLVRDWLDSSTLQPGTTVRHHELLCRVLNPQTHVAKKVKARNSIG